MKNAPNPYNAMAGFYRSAVIVSAVIFSAIYSLPVSAAIDAHNNYFYDAPSKTWIPTRDAAITPKGTVINNSAVSQAQRSLDGNGGFSNKSKITANFPKVNKSVPITINARVTPSAVKTAAKRVLKGGAAAIVIGAGLDALLNGLDWVMGKGGEVQKKTGFDIYGPVPDAVYSTKPWGSCSSTVAGWCLRDVESWTGNGIVPAYVAPDGTSAFSCNPFHNSLSPNDFPLTGFRKESPRLCYYGGTPNIESAPLADVPSSEIDSAVDSNYSPTLDDYPVLAPYLPPESTFIDPIARVNEPVSTTTVTDLDTGITTTTETNIWHDFDISNNPSTKPKIDVKTTQETNTYKDGQLTSTTTKTETSPADENQPEAGGAAPSPEIPIDCDLFPTACAWMEWTKEEPQEPDDNLSSLLKEVPISSKTFTISGGAAACPAPLVLNLSQFGSREVSYQPLCDLASTMKYLYLALMSFAAAVLLNRSINRV